MIEKIVRNFKVGEYDEIQEFLSFCLMGHIHYVLGQPTWKEDADYIYNWFQTKS